MCAPSPLPAVPHQEEPLRALLAHARATVPFYAGAGRTLADFPVVSKAIIRASLEGFISTRSHCDRRPLIAFLQHPHPLASDELPFDADITVELTSGSSGLPFCIPKTKAERVATSLGIWRHRKAVDPLVKPRLFYAIIHAPKTQVTPASYRELEAHLDKTAMRWIHAYPGFLERWAVDRARDPRAAPATLRYAENTGGFLSRDAIKSIEASLSLTVINQYGCREVSVMGYALHDYPFRPLVDNVVVEILDDEGAAITTAGQPGRVVVTGLHQRLLPFIRYDTGDYAEWRPDADGHPGLVLREGRPHELILGSRNQYGPTVFKSVMIAVYKELGLVELSYLQIRQLSARTFQVVLSPTPQAEAIRAGIARYFDRYEPKVFPFSPEFQLLQLDAPGPSTTTPEKERLFTNRNCVWTVEP